ncbi:serine/threonine protein phosphatase [Leptospira perolatii]|uniref:Serine/threonine protein phosphatase n=1 Tax=Leptospira perolatii TaxID=2023191 RepID=A0A2M9ZLR3_9LEPT|nr:SpoIIE family protein phosphatase [Leptospira perolatii]PJZ69757.1 serine/threonine protein phosphatase [Leptospira perolatii]PJZ73028.1 serine/threonine protein phosphatase [Leptospira perolatii]
MEDKKELLTDKIAATGPVTINRIRLGLVVLFLGSLGASWAQSSPVQNAAYLLGTATMAGFAIYNIISSRKTGKIPSHIGKISVSADIIILGIVMFVASWTDKDMASGVIRQIVLYAINMIFIVYSGLLLNPNFVIGTGILAAFCQAIIILNTIFRGVEFTEDELKVISPGYASISEQALKLVFLVVVSFITRSVIVIFRLIGAVEEEYANTLEEKVKDRTKEVTQKMEEIQALKVQQDGDYYLTSLLSKPLMTNWNTSLEVSTSFYIEQKKKFVFKNRESELGGDICISGNLLFGPDKERWIMFLNGDAMGKSMQGAGGAIVLGTAMNNIMTRSASNGRVLEKTPVEWMQQTYKELDNIFKTFDGVMMASIILGLVNEATGQLFLLNAEHPWAVIYRDGKSSFLTDDSASRKLGAPIESGFNILESHLMPRDIVFVGSDGRDDINISQNGTGNWTMNQDETLFLRIVEQGKGELDEIVDKLHGVGVITDDLSLIRIGFRESVDIDSPKYSAALKKYSDAKELLRKKDPEAAITALKEAWDMAPSFKEAARLLGQIYYDKKDYKEAAAWLEKYLTINPNSHNLWFLTSVCYKHLKDYKRSIEAAERVRISQPLRLANLVNLTDSYRLLGKYDDARTVLEVARKLDAENQSVWRLDEILKSKGF